MQTQPSPNEWRGEILISDSFEPLLYDKSRYLVLCGGKGSGKSEFAARKIFYRCQKEGNHRCLILRKSRKTAKGSVLEVMRRLLMENNIDFDYNKTESRFIWTNPQGQPNELLFDGLDEPEKIKSIKGLTIVWIEETTEFTEASFIQVDLAFREPSPYYLQLILSFNPEEALAPWLKKRFFDNIDPDATVHNSTIADNPIKEMREAYRRRLEAIEDDTLRAIYLRGEWAVQKGLIFAWDVVLLPDINFDEVFYGGDFGYSVDPAVVVRIYRKANEYWVDEVIYSTGLTNQALAAQMKSSAITGHDLCYFDSAEPKSIAELIHEGLSGVKPSQKGPDSVRAGIDYLKSQKIHIVEGAEHIINECRTYKWKMDRAGNSLPAPEKFNDHCLDSIRYGIFTHMKKAGTAAMTASWDVRPD